MFYYYFLLSPFTFFTQPPTPPLPWQLSVCLSESVSFLFISLFHSLDSTYEWTHRVLVFLRLAYFCLRLFSRRKSSLPLCFSSICMSVPASPQTRGHASFSSEWEPRESTCKNQTASFPPLCLQTSQTEAHRGIPPAFSHQKIGKYSQGRQAAEITKGSWTTETDFNPFRIRQPFLSLLHLM